MRNKMVAVGEQDGTNTNDAWMGSRMETRLHPSKATRRRLQRAGCSPEKQPHVLEDALALYLDRRIDDDDPGFQEMVRSSRRRSSSI